MDKIYLVTATDYGYEGNIVRYLKAFRDQDAAQAFINKTEEAGRAIDIDGERFDLKGQYKTFGNYSLEIQEIDLA